MTKLMKLASSQFGLFSREQAEKECGFHPEGIRWRLKHHHWEKVRRGVYRVFGMHSTWSQLAKGVLLRAGPGAALSHRTAAFLHKLDGLKKDAPKIIDVITSDERDWADKDVRLHITREEEIPTEVVQGLTVTSLARTVLDLADELEGLALEQALDSARRIRRNFTTQLDEYLATKVRKDRRPSRDARVIAIKKLVAERTSPLDSAPEVALLKEVSDRGLPKPVPGLSVYNPKTKKFIAKVDLGWKEQKVCAMFDSYLHHSGRADFDRDARQRAKLQAAGWSVVVVTARTLKDSEWTDAVKAYLSANREHRETVHP